MKVLIYGINGNMGKVLTKSLMEEKDIEKVYGVSPLSDYECEGVTIYKNIKNAEIPDVVIDFSHPSQLNDILDFCLNNNVPLVIATTGYNNIERDLIKETSKSIPIFLSSNMSIGVYIINELVKKVLENINNDFDIEILEKHHNKKVDIPSGTALTLINTIKENYKNHNIVIGRNNNQTKRNFNEIGVHSIRGGTVVGEHSVLFLGDNEIIEITHKVESRKVFAIGAIKAAKFIINQKAGLYLMSDLFKNGEV